MKLADGCSRCFLPGVRARGESYHRGGRVQIVHHSQDGVTARVAGTRRAPYEVSIDWSDAAFGDLEASCDCPHYQSGFLCKHIWATLLEVDQQRLANDASGACRVDVMHQTDVEDDWVFDDDDLDADAWRGPGLAAGTSRPSSARRRPTPPSWKARLAGLVGHGPRGDAGGRGVWSDAVPARREAWYVLNVSASVRQDRLVVDLFHRESLKSGGLGKIKKLKLRRGQTGAMTDPEDRALLELLLGNEAQTDGGYRSPYYHSSYRDHQTYSRSAIAPAMYEALLPRLCATGRFVWLLDDALPAEEGRSVRWDGGPAWRFRLHIESDASSRHWQIHGRLVRDGQSREMGDAVLLLAGGLVLFPEALARLDAASDFAWIAALSSGGAIQVPHADREELLGLLWSARGAPGMALPEDLQLDEVRVEPQGKLSIRAPERYGRSNQLQADVAFVYGDRVVSARDSRAAFVESEANRVLVRLPETERALLTQLAALGVSQPAYYDRSGADVRFPPARLPEVVDRLTAQGWIVESEGRRIRRPSAFHLSVRSDVDWFELEGTIDFDGATATLPRLLKALHSNEKYILLDDGSRGMLPEQWLRRYGGVIELGRPEEGALRFAPSQAMLLDALLAAQQDARVDRRFDRFCRKLRSFEGVRPCAEPRGFSGQLRPYQKEGLGWLNFLREFRFGGCLADDMGLGKTIQVLALLQSRRLRRMPKGQSRRPSIVVVPKSLVFNWKDEAARFAPRLRILDYTGTGRAALWEDVNDCDVLLTTYGTLRRDIVQLKDVRFDYAILDESQAIKNANSQTAKACRLLQADHRLAMTGTPVENHLGELWSLFEFLNPGMLGRSTAFESLMKNGRSDAEQDQQLQWLARSLRPFLLRRTKQQVLTDLPEKTEQTLYCELGAKQRKLYDELRAYYRTRLAQRVGKVGIQRAKIHVLEALLRLRQAACHPGLIDAERAGESSAKLDVLAEQVEEVLAEGHKALIFSQFTSLLAIVRRRLDGRHIAYEYLDGQTRRRDQRVRRFQEDPDCRLFLISLKAGGHGLNLTAADYVFILDPWWNPAVEAQAVDRAHRIGQTRRVFAYRLICRDTVEDKIVELQRGKRELADAIVSADNSLIRNLTAEDLQLLLS